MTTGDDKETPKPPALFEELVRRDPDAVAAAFRKLVEIYLPDIAARWSHEPLQKMFLEELRKESERLKAAEKTQDEK